MKNDDDAKNARELVRAINYAACELETLYKSGELVVSLGRWGRLERLKNIARLVNASVVKEGDMTAEEVQAMAYIVAPENEEY